MRNIALAIIVLAVTIPAMADVTITLDNDGNEVTIGYDCNEGEVVRAFALEIDVNDGAYVIGSAGFPSDPNTADYYVCPGSMTFTVEDGNTVIDDFGSPIAEEDANGGVLEIASLYAAADSNHPAPPASSGDLCTFAVDCDGRESVLVTITGENGKRGGVVLEDPNEGFTLVLPDPLEVPCACACYGEVTGDGMIQAVDVVTIAGWLNTYGVIINKKKTIPSSDTEHYDECADVNHDGMIQAVDVVTVAGWLNTYGVIVNKKKTIVCPHPYAD
jgi:hypothetical protein